MRFPESGEPSNDDPGTLYLRLVVDSRELRVVDGDGNIEGVIRREPRGRYRMQRGGQTGWALTSRSILMRRHVLTFGSGAAWDVETPFFWRLNLFCTEDAEPRVVGRVGPRKWLWRYAIEATQVSHDVLSALAFIHRRWWEH